MKAKPGEIWLADLGLAAKRRPVLIVSRDDADAPRALIAYVPFTTQHRGSRYEVPVGHLPFLDHTSVVNVQGIGALVEPHLERKLGHLPADALESIGVRSCNHTCTCSACFNRRLTVAACTPRWSAISASRYP